MNFMLHIIGLFLVSMLCFFVSRGKSSSIYVLGPFVVVLFIFAAAHIRRLDNMVGRVKKRWGIIFCFAIVYFSLLQTSGMARFGILLDVCFSMMIGLHAYFIVDKAYAYLSTVRDGTWLAAWDNDAKMVMFRYPPQEESDYSFYVLIIYSMSLLPWIAEFSWQAKKMFVNSVL